jgi:hypothetical protein
MPMAAMGTPIAIQRQGARAEDDGAACAGSLCPSEEDVMGLIAPQNSHVMVASCPLGWSCAPQLGHSKERETGFIASSE